MSLSKGKKFLYSRIILLAAIVGAVTSAFAGLKGFSFWYGGFVFCFWVAFGLINLRQKSTLWLALHRKIPFLLFLLALMAVSFIADEFGISERLWFYPHYSGLLLLWKYFVLYPFGALSVIELIYFLAGFFGEKLKFQDRTMTRWHGFFDITESIIFVALIGVTVMGAVGWGWKVNIEVLTVIALLWFIAAFIKLRFHIRHPGHYIIILLLAGVFALLLHEFPNTVAREWIYLESPILTYSVFGFPLWLWMAWYAFILVPLRLWIVLVLHPKVK